MALPDLTYAATACEIMTLWWDRNVYVIIFLYPDSKDPGG